MRAHCWNMPLQSLAFTRYGVVHCPTQAADSRLMPQELLSKCHPLGMFDAIATLAVASNMRELYRLVLVSLRGSEAATWCLCSCTP